MVASLKERRNQLPVVSTTRKRALLLVMHSQNGSQGTHLPRALFDAHGTSVDA